MALEMRGQGFPAFFDQAPRLVVRDPLAAFLGAAAEGLIEYQYQDAVRLAGHSCPTVAGAWLMAVRGLRALYGDAVPERGNVAVAMRDARDHGVTGVVASVLQLLTGAAAETGFQGVGPRRWFSRHQLLSYGQAMEGEATLTRRDTGESVQVRFDASAVPWPAEMRGLMPRVLAEQASSADVERFGQLWQERVRAILVDHADDAHMVQVRPAPGLTAPAS